MKVMLESGLFVQFPDSSSMISAIFNGDLTYMYRDTVEFKANQSFIILPMTDAVRYESSFGLQKNSEFTPLFKYYIAKMDETGVLDTLRLKNLPKAISNSNAAKSITLGFNNVLFPFLILEFGMIFGILLMFFEKLRIFR